MRKLECAEEAVEGELTCMHCLSVFRSPTTVVVTGKTYCAQCVVPALKQAEEDDDEDRHYDDWYEEGKDQVGKKKQLNDK